MPTDIARLVALPTPIVGPCLRCGSYDVRHVGHAHSLLEWRICNECSHVWGVADRVDAPAATTSAWAPGPRTRGRRLRARLVGFVTRVLTRSAAVACALTASTPWLQAQTAQPQAQTTQPQTAQPQQPPATHGVFASDAGMVLNFIKPDKTADFEAVMARLREALQKSEKPGRRQQAAGWKVMRALEPGPNGSVLYIFVIDPVSKGADYTVSTILSEVFPDEVQTLYKQYAGAYQSGQNVVNLTLVSALAQ